MQHLVQISQDRWTDGLNSTLWQGECHISDRSVWSFHEGWWPEGLQTLTSCSEQGVGAMEGVTIKTPLKKTLKPAAPAPGKSPIPSSSLFLSSLELRDAKV